MKILVAIDGSPRAQAGLESLVGTFGALRETPQVTLIHVHSSVPYPAAAEWVGKDAVGQYYEEETEAALKDARAFLDGRGIAYQVEKRVGDPAAEIISFAAAGPFDFIAMATHGHGALANLVLGSVAIEVVERGTVPVLLMKSGNAATDAG